MSNDMIKSNWNEVKPKVKQQWTNLADKELARPSCTRDELCGLIQKTYGYQKDRVEKELDTFIERNCNKNAPRAR